MVGARPPVQPRLEDGDQVLLRIVVTVDGFPAGPTPLLPGGDLLQERPAPLRGALGTGVELILWAVCVRVCVCGGGGQSHTSTVCTRTHMSHDVSKWAQWGLWPGPRGAGGWGAGAGDPKPGAPTTSPPPSGCAVAHRPRPGVSESIARHDMTWQASHTHPYPPPNSNPGAYDVDHDAVPLKVRQEALHKRPARGGGGGGGVSA